MRVGSGGYESLRFVHHEVDLVLSLKPLTVETDVVGKDIDLDSEFGDDFSIDGHYTALDQGVGLTA